jgi:hypothetical protein
MIVIYGVQYMGDGSVFGHTEAKSNIGAAIMGLLLALGAYALLNTINPDLVGTSGVNIQKVTIKLTSMDIPQNPGSNGIYSGTNYKAGDAWPDDQTVRDALKAMGVTVYGTKCSKVGDRCTSVYQLNTSFVSKLKGVCPNCVLNITGGTEFWGHGANNMKIHYPGGWTVDLQQTPTLSAFLHGKPKTYFPVWWQGSGANCYDVGNGLGVVEESDHFHAFSLTGGCDASKQGI